MNHFRNLYSESLTQQARINTYGSTTPVAEHEVYAAYSEFLSAAFSIGSDIALYCEQADMLAEREGLAKAFLYAEGDEGFFKKILNALIKVYNKAKDFVVKLLGRVKSDKSYRQDLTYLESLISSALKVTYNDNASITIKKARYGAIAGIVIGIMKENSILLEVAEGSEGNEGATVDSINEKLRTVLKDFTKDHESTIKAINTNLDGLRNNYPTKDAWLKVVYEKSIKAFKTSIGETVDTNVGDAKFDKNSAGTALEQVNKLWETATRTLKGDSDIKDFLNKFCSPLFVSKSGIQYDTISKALEKGVTELSDKIDDLKGLLKEAEGEASRVNSNSDYKEGDDAKKNASAASNMSVQYSNVMSMYTVVVTEGFNTAKVQLDRLIAEFKAYGTQIDKIRKNSSSSNSGGAAATEAEPKTKTEENK